MSLTYERADALSAADCDRVIALSARFPAEPGGVLGTGGYGSDARMRDVTTTLLPRADATAWLYSLLDPLMAEAAAALGRRVSPIAEPVQFLRYETGNHFAVWHSDAGADRIGLREVSASIELSDIADHAGGVLEIAPGRVGGSRATPRGGITAFPSRALHRVTPVTCGVRLALVIWAAGQADAS